ncbi:MAG: ATP-binding cassette domain-containing protein [Eubacteriales bacterium]|nr:ATP-binding cassette domain-containing protein [Eubacteriales bacterium]
MSQIKVTNLTFCYEGSVVPVFENVSFVLDTDWKLGFIGRNGKGKTTFLRLLAGGYSYRGRISGKAVFDYFPYEVSKKQAGQCAWEFLEELKPGCELWRVLRELERLDVEAALLYRPFERLSFGEQTKVLLAVLFSGEQDFLLIDEPTNHLDEEARETVKRYLQGKKGFILVSHDRDMLDACVDHVLVLNRESLEVQNGNFSSWWENKRRMDQFARAENEKHQREIAALKRAAEQSDRWAKQNESEKIGFDPGKEPDRFKGTRSYIGEKTRKLQARAKSFERRMERELEKKEGLLKDLENPVDLKLMPLSFHRERLLFARDLCLKYPGQERAVLEGLSFELLRGERVFLHGKNGCGKSTLLRAVLQAARTDARGRVPAGDPAEEGPKLCDGSLQVASGLVISYISQDTGMLRGTLRQLCRRQELEESLLLALLRQLDVERSQFEKPMEYFSEGQKKKVLIAASLARPAHLYIWDEPLNFVDVFSRMQLETLLLKYTPTMLAVDHDARFRSNVATRIVEL